LVQPENNKKMVKRASVLAAVGGTGFQPVHPHR
jgi:hypothetical protein